MASNGEETGPRSELRSELRQAHATNAIRPDGEARVDTLPPVARASGPPFVRSIISGELAPHPRYTGY